MPTKTKNLIQILRQVGIGLLLFSAVDLVMCITTGQKVSTFISIAGFVALFTAAMLLLAFAAVQVYYTTPPVK